MFTFNKQTKVGAISYCDELAFSTTIRNVRLFELFKDDALNNPI